MYKSAEHAISSSLFILSTPLGVGNPTGIVIDAMRQTLDLNYLRQESSGLSQHDWHANAQMIISRAQRLLGQHSQEWLAILARYGDIYNDDTKTAISLLADQLCPDWEQHAAESLILNVQRSGKRESSHYTINKISTHHKINRRKVTAKRADLNKKLHEIEQTGFNKLADGFEACGGILGG